MNRPGHPPATTPPPELGLRERKKQRTRRQLADTALHLFTQHGFDTVTLNQLVDTVEVSTRTFFRYFNSKEEVALAAEAELWDAYTARLHAHPPHGPLLAHLHTHLAATLTDNLPADWLPRFVATRALVAHTTSGVLRQHSALLTLAAQRDVVNYLEVQLERDSRFDVRMRLLAECSLGAWRCAARNWTSGRGVAGFVDDRGTAPFSDPESSDVAAAVVNRGGLPALRSRLAEAFDALPDSLTLTAPEPPGGSAGATGEAAP